MLSLFDLYKLWFLLISQMKPLRARKLQKSNFEDICEIESANEVMFVLSCFVVT